MTDDLPHELKVIPNDVQAELLAISEARDAAIRELEELSTQRLEAKHRVDNLADRQNELLRKVRAGETDTLFETDETADAELEATVGD